MKKVYLLNSISYYDNCSTILGCFMDYEKILKLVEDSEAYEKKYDSLFFDIRNNFSLNDFSFIDFSFIKNNFYIEEEPPLYLEELSYKTNEEIIEFNRKEISEEYPDKKDLFELVLKKYDLNKILDYIRNVIKQHPLNTIFEDGFSSYNAVIEGLPTLYITETNLFF